MSRPRSVSDRELLAAAKSVFLNQGVHAPVSAVASTLGLSVAALFFRMKSKEQLLLRALLPPFPSPEVTLLEHEVPPQKQPLKRLGELLMGLCNFLQEALPGFFLLHTAGVLPMKKTGAAPHETMDVVMRNALRTWLQRAQRRGLIGGASPAACADAIVGAMEARFLHAYLLKRTHTRSQNLAFVRSLLAAVLKPSSPRRRARQ